MENNPFEFQFKEISDEALIENLTKRSGYQPLAQKAMIQEAIFRKMIENETEKAISEGIERFQNNLINIQLSKQQKWLNWHKIIFYYWILASFLIGFISFFYISLFPIFLGIIGFSFFFLSFFLFRISKKWIKKEMVIQYQKPGEKGWIIFGYISSSLGGLIGLVIGLDFYLSCKKTGNTKLFKYDDNTRKQGLNMIYIYALIVAFIAIFIYFQIKTSIH